jgi:uncharacterized membrane protein
MKRACKLFTYEKNWFDFIIDKLIYWNGGIYSNKNDPNFLVPKASPGIGWNINFGNPKAVRFFILMMIVIIALIIGSILIS